MSSNWLTEADARDTRLRIDAATSSHAVFRVIAPDGRAVIVKQVPPAAAAAGRSLSRELFVYRLANWMPAVAAAIPHPVLIDEKYQLLVIESLDRGHVWPSPDGRDSIGAPTVAEQLGMRMAGWHQATQDIGLWMSPAVGILEMPDAFDVAAEGRAHTTQRLMRSIVDDRALSTALRATRANWRDRCLIHGDIRRENWIAARDARPAGLRVLDWELSGSGDPAWDLGSVLAEFAIESIRNDRNDARGWTVEQEPALRAFVGAYVAHDGLLDAREPREWDHVLLCGVARLLHVACEWAELQTNIDTGPVPAVIAQARGLLRHHPGLVTKLTRWSQA